MNTYEKQYFNLLLNMAVERFSERIIQRCEGSQNALERLRKDPHGEGIWIDKFVDAFFQDFLLDNPEGSSLILQALSNQSFNEPIFFDQLTIGELLQKMAKKSFANLLLKKTEEAIEQNLAFGGE